MREGNSARIRSMVRTAMLFGVCCVLSFAESALCGWLALPPGVKLGLANVAVMFTLFFVGRWPAAALVVLKALFGALTRGITAGVLSLAGGALSLGVLCLLSAVFGERISWTMLSVSGALAHNIGQLLVVSLWFESATALYYLPVLILSGVGMGFMTALCLRLLMPALKKNIMIFNIDNDKK